MIAQNRVRDSDLTAKARIRNIALDLFGRLSADRVSMRAVADGAGCTVGLVQHHFGTKEGLLEAVEGEIVDHFVAALREGAGDAHARDARVHAMLAENPQITGYLRRALLDRPGESSSLLSRLVSLSLAEVHDLRAAGIARNDRSEHRQVLSMMVRQFGVLFLDPMVAAVWGELGEPDHTMPRLHVTLTDPASKGAA